MPAPPRTEHVGGTGRAHAAGSPSSELRGKHGSGAAWMDGTAVGRTGFLQRRRMGCHGVNLYVLDHPLCAFTFRLIFWLPSHTNVSRLITRKQEA